MQQNEDEDLSEFPIEIQAEILREKFIRQLDYNELIKLNYRTRNIPDPIRRSIYRQIFQGEHIWLDKLKYELLDVEPEDLLSELIKSDSYLFAYFLIRDWNVYSNQTLCWAVEKGYTEIVRLVLPNINPSVECAKTSRYYSYPIVVASTNGYAEIVELLLADPRVDPAVKDNFAFIQACKQGHVEVAKLLLQDPRVDPTDNYNRALQMSVAYNHLDVVELLLNDPRIDPNANGSHAILYSSKFGYLEMVKLLLKHPNLDPTVDNNDALKRARKHPKILKLLLADPRVRDSLTPAEIAKFSR